jgi:flagellar protein FlaF
MQNKAALAYQQVGKQTVSARDLEANLLSRAATQLQRIRNDWDNNRHELRAALLFNRKLWGVFLTSVTSDESRLPKALRENVANLGIFVMNQTVSMTNEPEARKLDALININRELAAGLRASADNANAAG